MPDTPSIEAEYLPAAGALVFDPNLEAGAYAPSMVASPETWFAASESLRFVGTLYGQPFTIHKAKQMDGTRRCSRISARPENPT